MTRYCFALLAASFGAPCLSAAPVPTDGGKGTSFPFPATSQIVISLNGYDKARDRLGKMLAAGLPEEAEHLKKIFDEHLNKFLEGRKLASVRKDARAFFVANDLGGLFEGNMPFSVLIPITSYKEFRDTFLTKDELKSFDKGAEGVDSIKSSAAGDEATVFMVDLKEYVALAIDKTVAEGYAIKYAMGSTEPMGSEVADSFLKADLAIYVNMDAINEKFGDKIRQFRGLIDFGLQQAQQQGAFPGLNKKQVDTVKVVLQGLFQGVEDCRAIVLAGEFRPDGLAVRLQARFAEKTPTARFIESEVSDALKEIGKLPSGFHFYSESKLSESTTKFVREMNQEFATTEEDEKGAALLELLAKDRAAAGPRGEWSAGNADGGNIAVWDYRDAAKAAKAITKSYKAIPAGGRVNSVIVKSTPRVSDEAEKYKGFTFSEIKLQFDLDATVAALPEALKEPTLESLKKSIAEKTTIWIGTDGKTVVQLMAKDWEAAQATLEKYLDGKAPIESEAAFKSTRSQLPANASMVVIAETSSTVTALVDMIRSAAQAMPGAPQIGSVQPIKGAPTYFGLSVSLKGDTIGLAISVPTSAMAATRKMVDGLLRNIE